MPEKPSLLERFLAPSADDAGEALAGALRRPGVRKRAAIIGFTTILVVAIFVLAINPSLALQPSWTLPLNKLSDFSSIVSESEDPATEPTRVDPTAPPLPTPTTPPPSVSEVESSTTDGEASDSLRPTARITSPVDGASVPELSRFEGEFENMPADGCLWLFIESPWNSLLFPQGPLWDKQDGTFGRNVAIGAGNDDDHLKKFVVNVGWVPQVTCDLWGAIVQPVGTPIEGSVAGTETQPTPGSQ